MFYGLVADQFHPVISAKISFDGYPAELNKHLPVGGQIITGRNIERLNKTRVQFKHYNGMPSKGHIEDALTDTATFLTENVRNVFGVDYDALSMVDVIPQVQARDKIRAARTTCEQGDLPEGMALLVEAFQDLFEDPRFAGNDERPAFEFGGSLSHYRYFDRTEEVFYSFETKQGRSPGHSVGDVAKQLSKTTRVATELQEAMRVVTSGVDYVEYRRFRHLTPSVDATMDGTRHRHSRKNYAPTVEDFDFCETFVIGLALRLSAIDAQLK